MPPAVVYGPDGRPWHSWRVLILPYIEQGDLYKEYRFDEPWDSPHNIALLPRMPTAFAAPGSQASKLPPYHTICHVFFGKGAAFEGTEGVPYPAGFSDGTSSTILVVEAGEPVPWTKPEDLVYDPDGPLPDLRSVFKDGFRVGMADGSAEWVRKATSEATLRAAITRNGGEMLPYDWSK